MSRKLKILHLAPRFPFPMDNGGKIVIGNTFKFFSKLGAEVTFFCYSDEEISEKHKKLASEFGEIIFFNHSTANTAKRIMKSVFMKRSLFVDKHFNFEALEFLRRLCRENEFDVVHAEHSSMAPLAYILKQEFGLKSGLRLHNVEYLIWKRYADKLSIIDPRRIYVNRQAILLKRDEEEYYPLMDYCFTITEDERKKAQALAPTAKVINVGVGVNFEDWTLDPTIKRESGKMVLATIYKWRHNTDGVKWFLDNCMDGIRAEIPNAEINLLGKEPPEWLKTNYSSKGANVIGYVDSVKPYYNSASVYIAPLFVGAGVRIKILEAMAMALPVVATKVAAEGIQAGEQEGLFVSDNPKDFIDYAAFLLKNPDKASKLGANARHFIAENFSWEKNVGMMIEAYNKILST